MGNMSGSSGSHYTLWQTITQNSQDVANNKTNVTVKMYLSFDGSSWYAYTNYKTSGNMTINGTTHNYSIDSINFSSGVAKDLLLATWTGDIDHDPATGAKTLSVSGSWNTDTTKMGSGTCSASLALTTIARYANLTSLSVKSRTVNSITLSYTTDRPAWLFAKINNGEWLNSGKPFVSNTTSGTFTIYYKDRASTQKLDPNTTYNITVLCRALNRDSEIDTQKNTQATTYDIARISSLANFEHGSNPMVSITNPASISSLSLVMNVSNTQILSRTVLAGNNTITFSDTELDNLYKKYGSSSSLTATFVLSGSGYTNSKTCTVTLKGNQKVIRTNVSSTWKRGKLWTNVNGTWKRGVLWTNVNGTWKRGI